MRLILHIGRPKTGTTSLQQFLYENRRTLSSAGFFLFDDAGIPNNIDFPAFFSGGPKGDIANWYRRRGLESAAAKREYFESRGFLEAVDKEIESARRAHHTAIITSEQFTTVLNPEEISTLSEYLSDRFDHVTLVCFVRDQVDVIPSSWSTSLKGGWSQSLRHSVKQKVSRMTLDYNSMAKNWSHSFAGATIDFHRYVSDEKWDIRKYFSTLYLASVQDLEYPSHRSNEAYRHLEARLIRMVNRFVPMWLPGSVKPNPRNVLWRKRAGKLTRYSRRAISLTPRQARRVREAFAESNRLFSQRYLPPGESL